MRNFIAKISKVFYPGGMKGSSELDYWRKKRKEELILANDHYVHFYTKQFGLTLNYYKGKKILDIGCGPRGSLEWAQMASERIGLDPLAASYLKLGAKEHDMTYVTATSDRIPFVNEYFDVVTSFNSLDHVDDLNKTITEIARVTKPGGYFLLISDVNHDPTPCEPIYLSWDVVKLFQPFFDVVEERHYEASENGIYQSIDRGIRYDHHKNDSHHGIITVKFRRLKSAG